MSELIFKEFHIPGGMFHSGYEFHRVRVWDIDSRPSVVELRRGDEYPDGMGFMLHISYGVLFVVEEVEL